jgi:hypothetical protein
MTDGRKIDSAQTPIRLAGAADAPAFGRLLHAFSAEFGDSTPAPATIAERAPLIESGEVTVLVAGDGYERDLQRRGSLPAKAAPARRGSSRGASGSAAERRAHRARRLIEQHSLRARD